MSDGKIRLVSSGSRTYVRRWSNEQHAINMFKAVEKTKQKSLQHFHQASAQIHNELSLQYTSILLLALGELFLVVSSGCEHMEFSGLSLTLIPIGVDGANLTSNLPEVFAQNKFCVFIHMPASIVPCQEK